MSGHLALKNVITAASIGGLALWLDAADGSTITQSSSRVSQWKDKSGNGNHAAQATGGLQPLYVANAINSLPAIQFRDDGTAKLLSAPDSTSLKYVGCSIFTVFTRLVDLGTNERICGKFSTASPANQREVSMLVSGSDTFQGATSSAGSAADGLGTTTKTIALSTPYIADATFSASFGTVKINNETATQATGSIAGLFNGTSPFHVGAFDGAGQPFAGYIGEVLFFTRALASAARMDVLRYLSRKWGVALLS
jgi:hypothetical protein